MCILWVPRTDLCLYGGGGGSAAELVNTVYSLKYSQQAQVLVNLVGLSFAWQIRFSMSAILSSSNLGHQAMDFHPKWLDKRALPPYVK